MAGSTRPASDAITSLNVTISNLLVEHVPHLTGQALVVALLSIVCVPVLAGCRPGWIGRLAMPLFAVTAGGVYLTVPDVEHVRRVWLIVVAAAIICVVGNVAPHRIVVAATALLIIGAATLDSGGRGAAIVRAAGCFGVLLADPFSEWWNRRHTDRGHERRPKPATVVIVHCVVVAWSSRALIRQTSTDLVIAAVGGALVAAIVVLCATARLVATEQ